MSLAFVKEVLSDSGQPSYSRCASAFIVLSVVGWVTYALLKAHAIPDLQGPAWFLSTGVGVHYGSNKMPDIIASFKNKLGDIPKP